MIRDHERFAKLAAGVQSLVIAGAFIVGGWWSYHTFGAQLQVENAEAQLAKLKRDLAAEAQVEVTLDISAIDDSSINPSDSPPIMPSRKRRHFVAVLSAKNLGSGPAFLNLNETPVEIFHVTLDKYGTESWSRIRQGLIRADANRTLGTMRVGPGASNSAAFVIAVDSPGLYVGVVSANVTGPARDTDLDEMNKHTGRTHEGDVTWSAQRYFTVK